MTGEPYVRLLSMSTRSPSRDRGCRRPHRVITVTGRLGFGRGPWYLKGPGRTPPREVVHRSPLDHDAAGGLHLARRDIAVVRPRPAYSRGHLADRRRLLLVARGAERQQGVPGLLRGRAGRGFAGLLPGALLWAAGGGQPPGAEVLHAAPAASGARLLPQVRQQGRAGRALHPGAAVHDLLHRRD